MIKNFMLCLFFFLLTGCVGDRLAFHQAGHATVSENRICITASPGDILEYYLLTSSENNYEIPLSEEDNIAKKYPDTCIPLVLKNSTSYELIYELSGKKYRFEFKSDAHKKVKETYSQ
ncbi:MAG: putative T6SS immunity periplasmic lipoprotein [Serratia inhibens]|uniref:putative T6SS immunity periplasmic lipoprotein n=1 Tax=Serratia inhibens TaxID=2338073 RepID=UPI003C7AC429